MKPTFDEWFIEKYHMTFEEKGIMRDYEISVGMKLLTQYLRDYVSEMVQND